MNIILVSLQMSSFTGFMEKTWCNLAFCQLIYIIIISPFTEARKVPPKHFNYITCLAKSSQNHVYSLFRKPTSLKDYKIQWSLYISLFYYCVQGGHFKNVFELLNLRAPKNEIHIFQCTGKMFGVDLWISTQNILSMHWKMQFLYKVEYLRALISKSL